MKLLCVLALAVPFSMWAANPQIEQAKTIYVLPMGNSIDQFLANRLTMSGILQVVTDAQKADVVFTDRLGEPFETKLQELYPSLAPPPVKEEKDESAGNNTFGGGAARVSSIGRGRGNFFIVDPKSRAVLWSVYELPKGSSPEELTQTARKVVKRLKDDLAKNQPSK